MNESESAYTADNSTHVYSLTLFYDKVGGIGRAEKGRYGWTDIFNSRNLFFLYFAPLSYFYKY